MEKDFIDEFISSKDTRAYLHSMSLNEKDERIACLKYLTNLYSKIIK